MILGLCIFLLSSNWHTKKPNLRAGVCLCPPLNRPWGGGLCKYFSCITCSVYRSIGLVKDFATKKQSLRMRGGGTGRRRAVKIMALSICIVIFKIKIFDAHFFLFSSHTTHITRHKKSVKIGVGLFLLTIFCYTSVILAVNSNRCLYRPTLSTWSTSTTSETFHLPLGWREISKIYSAKELNLIFGTWLHCKYTCDVLDAYLKYTILQVWLHFKCRVFWLEPSMTQVRTYCTSSRD